MSEKQKTRQKEETLSLKETDTWYCDTDCRDSNRACRGEEGKDMNSKKLCPFYNDMLF